MKRRDSLSDLWAASAAMALTLALCHALPAAEPERLAKQVLAATGVRGGLVVHVGCGDGSLTAALRANERFLVQGLDADPANVDAARQHVRKLGLYGPVSVRQWTGGRLPYAENMVNLLVAEDAERSGGPSMAEVRRVLAPLGVAYIRGAEGWVKTVKPWPADIDEWTHFLHGPGGNAVARDKRVAPPRSFQWAAGPLWSRHHDTVPSVSAMVSARGRVFYIVDEAPVAMTGNAPDKWALVARDAFNGIELWRKPIADWGWRAWSGFWKGRFNQPNQVAKRLVAVGDRVYATLGFNAPLTAIDAATGKVLRTYKGTECTDEILFVDGTLVLSINQAAQGPGTVKDKPPVKKSVVALAPDTGKVLWTAGSFTGNSTKTGPVERVTHLLLAASGGRVFLMDGDAVVGLDLKSGKQLWRSARPKSPDYTSRYEHRMSEMCTLVADNDVVFLCQLEPIQKRIGWGVIKARLQAYSAETGKPLWQTPCGNWGHFCVPDVFVTGGLVWVHDAEAMSMAGLDRMTGAEKKRISTKIAFTNGHHHRCYRNKATERYLMTSFRGFELMGWDANETHLNHWVRGTCRLGGMPCNGMIYATPHPCDCYITSMLDGFYALAGERNAAAAADKIQRLVKGPAYTRVPQSKNPQSPIRNPQLDDWPTYRADSGRSGHTASAVPARLKPLWQADLKGRLTAPVVAGGKVYVASVDTHEVCAMDAASGETLWRHTAGGRVDTPPTVYEGLVLFGSRDGWVTCLRDGDGEVAWRFLAAPVERLVGAHGGLESAWPVHGSVLVHDGSAYVTAGRSSFLDGGIVVYRLRPETGELLEQTKVSSEQGMLVDWGRDQSIDTGSVTDVLVADGQSVHMRHRRLFGRAGPRDGWQGHLASTAGLLDDSWFNRTHWMLDGRACGRLLVHDESSVYGVRAYESLSAHTYHDPNKPGYKLTAWRRPIGQPISQTSPGRQGANTVRKLPSEERWTIVTPVRVRSMVLAGSGEGQTLFAAGTLDALDPSEPWAVYEGKRGGALLAISAGDGAKLAEIKLDSAPVYDGMAAAGGRLFVSTVDGKLLCLGKR